MKIECSYDKIVQLTDLTPHPKNPNQHPEAQIKLLAKIMKENGVRHPIKVSNLSGYITGGHCRLLAALHNGWTEFPVDYQDYKSVMYEYADLVADNQIAMLAEFSMSKVNEDFVQFGPELDCELLGIPDFKIEPMEKYGSENDDVVPEVQEDPITKTGDLIELGNHRLLCGDSTIKENVDKLMNGEKADMVFTDPPYGMNLDTDYSALKWGDRKGKKYEKVIGDNEDFKPELITSIFNNFGYCKEIFLWGADYYYKHIKDFDNGHYIVWDKTLDSNGDAGSNSEFELCWTKTKHKRQVIHFNWFRYFGLSKQDIKNRVHPTQKPLQVCEPFVLKYSKENNIIIDLFGGSGSTLIACEKTNRKCYMMEIDPHYCDVIIKRYCDYVGNKEFKRNGAIESIGQ